MRLCPKCRDYYADASLAFCLNDGTPLIDVSPRSESWSEGERVIEEKENALRKQARKIKWRRVLFSAMTMLITTLVVFVVAVNSFIYLKPEQEEVAPGAPVSTWPTVTPSPTASPGAATIITQTPTPTPKPSSSPRPTPSPSPQLTSTPAPTCTDADKSREREIIIRRFGDRWRRNIESERSQVIARNAPAGADNAPTGVDNAEASLGPIEYQITFPEACMPGFVRARYAWQIRTNVNGTIRVATVAKEKRFTCLKVGGAWLCR